MGVSLVSLARPTARPRLSHSRNLGVVPRSAFRTLSAPLRAERRSIRLSNRQILRERERSPKRFFDAGEIGVIGDCRER